MSTILDRSELRRMYAIEAGGSAGESLGGVGVVALSVLALVNASEFPPMLTATAPLLLGGAIVLSGATLSSRMLTHSKHSRAIR